jgi:NADH pyrophosphatase NudC (nudix superfamily)
MTSKCPGSNRNISAEIIKCPFCGMDVELFSDEMQRRCPGCKNPVFHDVLPACISWCAAAKECMDVGKWLECIKTNSNEKK